MEMKSFCRRRCLLIVCLMMSPVDLQVPMGPVGYPMPMQMPMPMPPPMFAPAPPPMPIGVPVPIPMIIGGGLGGKGGNGNGNGKTTTTTTTTEPPNDDVIQVPLPVEISIYPSDNRYPRFYPAPFPGPPPAPFPPPPFPGPYAPPYGMPLPMPMVPPPPPLVVLPSWTKRKRNKKKAVNTDDSCSNERKRSFRKHRQFRRTLLAADLDDNELVKPVLTYVSRDGDIKLKQKLSNDEAADLMDDDKSFQTYRVIAGEDSDNKQRVLVVSNNERTYENRNHRRRQVILRTGSSQHGLGQGRKELVFRPPGDKKISNLSVSFQISDR